MKKSSNPRIDSQVEPDRLGQMGGKRPADPSIRSQFMKHLRANPKSHQKNQRSGTGSTRYGLPQRVSVKVNVCRHKPGKAAATLRRHVSYLGRESASQDGQKGKFFEAQKDATPGRSAVTGWEADRHHFRLIISPEHGADIPDLQAYTREVMRRVERDLETPLEWIAVSHHNTDNPHVHVLLRGNRADGQDLVIPREYISRGIRDRASQVATEILGERTQQEVHAAKLKEVTAERFTSLDRMIERHLEDGQLDVAPHRRIGFATEDRTLVVGRLQFLQTIDLARKGKGTRWHIEPAFKTALRELGDRNDLIRQLYQDMGREAGNVDRVGPHTPLPLTGIVVAKGSVDEISEVRFLVVRDDQGKAHYAQVPASEAFARLQPGSVVQLGSRETQRRTQAHEILAVASQHGGQYDSSLHAAYLREQNPGRPTRDQGATLRAAAGRLEFITSYPASGVTRLGEGRYQIDPDKFRAFSERPPRQLDAQVVAAYPLDQQVTAQAWTWLDRQREQAGRQNQPHGSLIADAARQRQDWLMAQGYADRAPSGIQLRPGAKDKLSQLEQTAKDHELTQRYGKPVGLLPDGARIHGTYKGTQERHSGLHAIIASDDRVFVAPVAREPAITVGASVSIHNQPGQAATLTTGSARSADRGMEAGR